VTNALDATARITARLDERGYTVLRAIVPPEAVEAALRHIHVDLVRRGLPSETLSKWLWSSHWFPHLRWDPPIVALTSYLPEELREGELCDPQILLQPPDNCEDQPLVSHVDQEPEWAQGRRYQRIVGVALTPARAENGGLVVWPFDGEEEALDLAAGDAVVMHPQLPHASGLNREGAIRYAVYFRFLELRETA
jgi:ectoine hydroxylase-related dioxygenase (phytanoyl-CoA dioxygenase family)